MTPLWRSRSAAKVRAYRFVHDRDKSDCARITGLSRSTVIKWWDQAAWTPENSQDYHDIQNWFSTVMHYQVVTPERCSKEIGIPLEKAKFEFAVLDEIFRM